MIGSFTEAAPGEPLDTVYGWREFEYADPEGTVLRVGSPLAGPGG
jgi:hypothetical protein